MRKVLLLNIFLLFAIAAASAKIAANIISDRLSHFTPPAVTPSSTASLPSSEEFSSFSPILETGLFGKATRGKLVSIAAPSANKEVPAASLADLLLLGTVVGSYRETFAFVQKVSTREERVFRLGEKIFDFGQLVAVTKESIVVSVGGRRETVFAPTAVPTESAAPQPAAGAAPPLARQVSEGSYIISQRALEAALSNMSQAMTDARLLPSTKDGKVEGFKVAEVRPGGIFSMVGIRNGDVLLRINDFNINSPESAIQSLASLKGLSRISLDLIRNGQPTTLTYDIR